MFNKSKPRSPKAKPSTQLPEWANGTPKFEYCLQMEAPSGEHLDAIYDLTRAEYAALKLHLAGMRRLAA
jgi:hypothetical protein